MEFKSQKFTNSNQADFYTVLKSRVNDYFDSNQRSKNANSGMVVKTIVMFSVYLIPYFLMMFGLVTEPWVFLALWGLMGFGMAGIGLGVMHDANHGSYSSNRWVNKYVGYSMNIIGANAEIWKIQHNTLHHTFTNIHGIDDDINTPPFLRFSPYSKKRWIHKYQYLFVWFFYGVSTISWVTMKEFVQAYRYKKLGLIKGKEKFREFMIQLISWKVIYYSYILILPILFMPVPIWLVFVSFLFMHFVAGLTLSLIFQTAHIMPECDYILANPDKQIEQSWAVHEMLTTCNYAPKSRILSWYIGGLNFQIEHHLFPHVCHVHYKTISKIVSETANEYNIKYNSHNNFVKAIRVHAKMLYDLGRVEIMPVPILK